MEAFYGGLGALLVLGVAVLISYNRFVEQRNLIRNSWSNVETELQRRYDLIPNLVESVKGYAAHERHVLERVTEARAAASRDHGSPGHQAATERRLVAAMRQLLAVVESYPALKASHHFLRLQDELVNTEDRLAAARRFYNANVRDLNRRVQSIPSNLVASAFGFTEQEYFEVDEVVRRSGPPRVDVTS
ncbi:MAG TPA: LemA family protein [Actinomycetota bacterium]|nr:LemA family protein [Actinomycetota bacterium]